MKLVTILQELKTILSTKSNSENHLTFNENNLSNYNVNELAKILRDLAIGSDGIHDRAVFLACVAYMINSQAQSLEEDVWFSHAICLNIINAEILKFGNQLESFAKPKEKIPENVVENISLDDMDDREIKEIPVITSEFWDSLYAAPTHTESLPSVNSEDFSNRFIQLKTNLKKLVDEDGLKMGLETLIADVTAQSNDEEVKKQGRLIIMLDRACHFKRKEIQEYFNNSTISETATTSMADENIIEAQQEPSHASYEVFNSKKEYAELQAASAQFSEESEEEEEFVLKSNSSRKRHASHFRFNTPSYSYDSEDENKEEDKDVNEKEQTLLFSLGSKR